jgi:hypothetical protein
MDLLGVLDAGLCGTISASTMNRTTAYVRKRSTLKKFLGKYQIKDWRISEK